MLDRRARSSGEDLNLSFLLNSWPSCSKNRRRKIWLLPKAATRLQGATRSHGRCHLLRFGREVLARIDESIGFEVVLLVVERSVPAAELEQLRVRAAFDDLAVLEHEDLIGAADRRETMRDHERGTAPAQR